MEFLSGACVSIFKPQNSTTKPGAILYRRDLGDRYILRSKIKKWYSLKLLCHANHNLEKSSSEVLYREILLPSYPLENCERQTSNVVGVSNFHSQFDIIYFWLLRLEVLVWENSTQVFKACYNSATERFKS